MCYHPNRPRRLSDKPAVFYTAFAGSNPQGLSQSASISPLGIYKADRRGRAEKLLAQVGITGNTLKRVPGKLSGGEQQRVAIARALANKPKLVLADETTGNLDTQTSQTIVDLLRTLARSEQTTILTVTHDQAIAGHADRVFRLSDGKLALTQ